MALKSAYRFLYGKSVFMRVTGITAFFFFTHVQAQVNRPTSQNAAPAATAAALPVVPAGIPVSYVRTFTPNKPYTNELDITNGYREVKEVNRSTEYVDGLGRALQRVDWRASPQEADMVEPILYDYTGREKLKYLPYPSGQGITANGLYKPSPFAEQAIFFNQFKSQQPALTGENIFYSVYEHDIIPLEQTSKMLQQGNSWAGTNTGIEMRKLVNSVEDDVKVWAVGFSQTEEDLSDVRIVPEVKGVYAEGALLKTVAVNEHGVKTVEFKDKNGRLILSRTQAVTGASDGYINWLCTYYIYDSREQLRFVIPPKAVEKLRQASWNLRSLPDLVSGLCYRYEYDYRNRKIARKAPGADWVFMVYDMSDRLVYTQDANLRADNKKWWMTTLYDAMDRPVQTGMLQGFVGTRKQLADALAAVPAAATTTTIAAGTYPAGVGSRLYLNIWKPVSHYQATESIEFQDGFESGINAEFEADIVQYTPATFSGQQTVTNWALPTNAVFIPLTYTYYDNYNWLSANAPKPYSTASNGKLGIGNNVYGFALPAAQAENTTGRITGTRVRVIEDATDLTKGAWLEAVHYFDNRGSLIQVVSDNYKGGKDVLSNRFNFSGKIISSYLVHTNPRAGFSNSIYTETDYDHVGRIMEVRKTLDDNTNETRVVSNYAYDAMGQVKTKRIGQKAGGNWMETQDYTYNIRGWLKGINWQGYEGTAQTVPVPDRWFAMDLNYDRGFETKQLNGNVAGVRWKSAGDGMERSYGYGYDAPDRLLYADFREYDGGWKNDRGIDFSMHTGEHTSLANAYDANSNLLKMYQKGMKTAGSSDWIDGLTYQYEHPENSNRLARVTEDVATNDPNSALGDYHLPNGINPGYAYNENGSMVKDLSKGIGTSTANGILYSYLNIPHAITMYRGPEVKGIITYISDALGNKLEKRVEEKGSASNGNIARTLVTSYINGYVYENDQLSYFGQEEGRVRPLRVAGTNELSGFVYDYFLKDYLGNIRTVLTDEEVTAKGYITGMEPGTRGKDIQLFDKIAETEYPKPDGFDSKPGNTTVSRLFGLSTDDRRIGPGIVLKVMKGDKFSASVQSWYAANAVRDADPSLVTSLASMLASAFTGALPAAGAHQAGAVLPSGSTVADPVGGFLSAYHTNSTATPKAYLNWMLLDEEQFKLVNEGSGAVRVPVKADTDSDPLSSGEIDVTKNGYLYVYVSNESKGEVYFDDIQVIHTPGPLMEETHYYPFGMVMAGISSRAAQRPPNRQQYNGKELQSKEFSDNTGLNWLDYGARTYDPQIGRFFTHDRFAESYSALSPYQYVADNPVSGKDINGDWIYLAFNNRRYVYQDFEDGEEGFYDEWTGEKLRTTNYTINSLISVLTFFARSKNGEVRGRMQDMMRNSKANYVEIPDLTDISDGGYSKSVFDGEPHLEVPEAKIPNNGTTDLYAQFGAALLSRAYNADVGDLIGSRWTPNAFIDPGTGLILKTTGEDNAKFAVGNHQGQSSTVDMDKGWMENQILAERHFPTRRYYVAPILWNDGYGKLTMGNPDRHGGSSAIMGLFRTNWIPNAPNHIVR